MKTKRAIIAVLAASLMGLGITAISSPAQAVMTRCFWQGDNCAPSYPDLDDVSIDQPLVDKSSMARLNREDMLRARHKGYSNSNSKGSSYSGRGGGSGYSGGHGGGSGYSGGRIGGFGLGLKFKLKGGCLVAFGVGPTCRAS